VNSAWNHHGKKVQPNPLTVSLFDHRNLWQYVEGGGNLKYGIAGNFCSQTSIGH
jgi:hypothetical protein